MQLNTVLELSLGSSPEEVGQVSLDLSFNDSEKTAQEKAREFAKWLSEHAYTEFYSTLKASL